MNGAEILDIGDGRMKRVTLLFALTLCTALCFASCRGAADTDITHGSEADTAGAFDTELTTAEPAEESETDTEWQVHTEITVPESTVPEQTEAVTEENTAAAPTPDTAPDTAPDTVPPVTEKENVKEEPKEDTVMDTVKINKKNTLLVAHRGLSGLETENTNAAFIAAGERSYYGIECDIHRTADGRFVVIHDADLKRVAGVELDVESSTLEQLQSHILFDKKGEKSRDDLRVGTLEDYISICKRYGKRAVLELKSAFTEAETAEIVRIIEADGYLGEVTFISFDYSCLEKVRAIRPETEVQYLFAEVTDEIIERLARDGFDADVQHRALTAQNIAKMHDKGIKVNCWTVDDPARAEQLAAIGVDFITTNILE